MNENEKHQELKPDHGPIVDITINGEPKRIHRGHHKVSEIKQLGGIPLADDLEQIIEGKLILLLDDGGVTIKGGEAFVGHPKDSASS